MNAITIKQTNFILKLDPSQDQEELKKLDIRQASILIKKLLKGQTKEKTKPTETKEIKRNHNFKVGDVLAMCWGYDQTNYDFFRIKELKGASSIIIQEVRLETTSENWYSNGMAKDAKYNTKKYEILKNSIFVKNNEVGEIKRIQFPKWANGEAYINGWHGHSLFKYDGQEVYESFYA
ncbi:MAG: hypothetical protein J6T10_02705 [Methanobrevibacter sp.]|nr:hypothetical protein [Methanobrevibacter sp.]